ncbi:MULTISPECIES: DMT family transporter [Neobacillus]|uniref:EamA family transporter n=1 Tax=Neobacillus rhizophilus TaxID=2833579 RepID=A0A942YV72_9BACI|nr:MULTISPECIES: EamA family transporter [Neobacillus]MBS4211216.1 EamA family transporter [Neobacillus rhizophilus]MBU8918740.1 EamA family transporter [Bacillus sp. FJAT-29953]
MNSHGAVLPYPRAKGIILVIIAAVCWGASGTVAQYLFHNKGFNSGWTVVIRLLLSGTGLLFFAHTVAKQNIWNVWKNKQDVIQLVLFGIFGMLAAQYTYFAAIEYSNAAAATVLQYLAPVMIASYLCLRKKKLPSKLEVMAILFALGGTFLLVTKGNIHALAISVPGFAWGILSAFALAFYTLYPGRLLAKWGSLITVGWGMMIGGIVFSFVYRPWQFHGDWSGTSFLAMVFVIIFGTIIAFFCYMESMKYINASEASLLASAEPLSAAFLSVAWLQVSFGPAEWLGTFAIIATIFILSAVKK